MQIACVIRYDFACSAEHSTTASGLLGKEPKPRKWPDIYVISLPRARFGLLRLYSPRPTRNDRWGLRDERQRKSVQMSASHSSAERFNIVVLVRGKLKHLG